MEKKDWKSMDKRARGQYIKELEMEIDRIEAKEKSLTSWEKITHERFDNVQKDRDELRQLAGSFNLVCRDIERILERKEDINKLMDKWQ